MHRPPLMIADYVAPAIAGVIFVLAMSLVREHEGSLMMKTLDQRSWPNLSR